MLKVGPHIAFLLRLQQGTILKAFHNCKQWNFSKCCSGNASCQESPNFGILKTFLCTWWTLDFWQLIHQAIQSLDVRLVRIVFVPFFGFIIWLLIWELWF